MIFHKSYIIKIPSHLIKNWILKKFYIRKNNLKIITRIEFMLIILIMK